MLYAVVVVVVDVLVVCGRVVVVHRSSSNGKIF